MAIGKIVSEAVGTLSEEVAKRGKRTEFKELSEVPEEIKALPEEERVTETDAFLEEDKALEFTATRQKDILLDQKAQGAKISKHKEKKALLEEQQKEIELKAQKPDLIIGAEQKKEHDKYLSAVEANEAKLEAIRERERDLYQKADNLKKERTLTNIINEEKSKGVSVYNTLKNILTQKPGSGYGFSNIEARTEAIYKEVNAEMFELKEALRTKRAGTKQDIEAAHEVIRYLKDGKVKNEARLAEIKKIADQWTKGADHIKNLRNQSGARIGKLEDWIVPQSHEKRKILKAGFKAWSDNIKPKLDIERIEKERGGNIDDILASAHKNITTPKVEFVKGVGSNVAKRGETSRVLHFKTGDDIINYNKEFGNPDFFSTMDSHIRQQSNEIATLQLFGSNPQNTFDKLKELARADGMGGTGETDLDQAFRLSTGQVDGDDIISNLDATLATIGGTHRAIQVSSKLGSALVSSLADISSIVLGSGYRGLSSVNIMGKALSTLLQDSVSIGKVGSNIELANRIGVISEFASASLANSRYAEVGAGAAQKAAEVVIRASGLGAYTNAMRVSVGLEFAGAIADNVGKSLDKTPFSGLFKEYGITADEWDIIRKTELHMTKGAKFFDSQKLYKVDRELGYKVSEMITNEMDSFVIMPTNRTRIWTTWGEKKGTVRGELARNMMLFKSFPIASTIMHLGRIGKIDSTKGKLAYGGALIGVNTVMGGITLWAYDIVTGKTPRSIDRPAFVGEAIAKSGGLGIFGDFFIGMADNVYGKSFSSTLIGVPASTLDDIIDTAQDLITKDGKTISSNAYNRAKSYIPGQNLWYTRTPVERTVGKFMNELINAPEYRKRERRKRKAMRLRGQKEIEFWK